jgi:integrase
VRGIRSSFCVFSDGIGAARIDRYLTDLSKLAHLLQRDFDKATREDWERVLRELHSCTGSYHTMLEYKKTIKKFYRWLNGGECPESVKWIKTTGRKNNTKLPEELLTEADVKAMIQAAGHPRNRAIISVLWESGCRAGELLSLQIKHVVFEESLTRIMVKGKTGMRRVPLIDSTPYLAEWIENHPFRDDPDAPLWVGIGTVGRNEILGYPALRKLLKDAAVRAGIKKAVHPHNFRHSRATLLAKHLTEAELTQYLGWVQGSKVPAVYVHLSGRDVDDAILRMRGIKPKEEKPESTLAPKECPRCRTINKATGRFCTRCGAVLDIETAVTMQDEIKKLDEIFAELLQDPEVQSVLLKRMRELAVKPR